MGVIQALAQEGDVVFSDALNHASIIDGCRLARAETFVYRHLDTEHLEYGLRQAGGRGSLIVTDGVFSMDGDVAPLARIVELARRYDARVMVDEAHATGVLGPGGRGSVAAAGLQGEVDVIVGTLGKALGSYGAYVCCDKAMKRYLVNTARTLIFSTGPAAAGRRGSAGGARDPVEQPRRVERLGDNAAHAADGPRRPGSRPARRETPIVPLVVGDADPRWRCASGCCGRGVCAGDPAADGAGRHVAAAPRGDGDPQRRGAAPGRRRAWLARSRPAPARRAGRRTRAAARKGLTTMPRSAGHAPRGLFVTGTDTEVGKTVVASAIAATLAALGERVSVFKPAVTGLDEPDGMGADHDRLRAAARSSQPPSEIAPYRFGPPVSPHLAAAAAGERDGSVPAAGRGPPRRAAPATCSSRRASAGCWSRCPATTSCATSPPTSACRS